MYSYNQIDERYPIISFELLKKEINDLIEIIGDFLDCAGYPEDLEYRVSIWSLAELVVRVDKRSVYYQYFHKGTHINEKKQAALLAYWILKFKPIIFNDVRYRNEIEESTVNEWFACYVVEAMLRASEPEFDTVAMQRSLHDDTEYNLYFDRLHYSFRYQGHTIDSLMMVVETIAPQVYEMRWPGDAELA